MMCFARSMPTVFRLRITPPASELDLIQSQFWHNDAVGGRGVPFIDNWVEPRSGGVVFYCCPKSVPH